jgi:hypothetical protein
MNRKPPVVSAKQAVIGIVTSWGIVTRSDYNMRPAFLGRLLQLRSSVVVAAAAAEIIINTIIK